MHNSVRMTIFFSVPFLYFFCKVGLFSCFLASFTWTTNEVDHPWFLSSHSEFLGIPRSNFAISPSTRRLQHVNSVMHRAHSKCYSKYRSFKVLQINILSVIILQTYYEVYPGPYYLRIFHHRSTRHSYLSTSFLLYLSERPFVWLVSRRLLLLKCLPTLWCGWILTYWVSLVLQGVFQTPWIFSCGSFSDVSDLEKFKGSALGGSFGVFCPSELLAFHRPNSSEVSALVVGLFIVSACLEEFFGSVLVPCSLFIAGILRSFCMDCLATASDVPGSIVPAFYWHRLLVKKVSQDFLPFSPTDYFNSRLSSFSVMRIDQYNINRIKVSIVLRV